MEHEWHPSLVRNLVIKVFQTNGALVNMGNTLVRDAGLTTAWWQVLGALGYSPVSLPVAHIARNMGLSRQAVQRVVDLLLQRGFITLEDNPHHQRARLVVLTEAGRLALSAAEAAEAPMSRVIHDKIGAERLALALAVLTDMNELIAQGADPRTAPPSSPHSSKDAT